MSQASDWFPVADASSTGGCTGDLLSAPPEFSGTILETHYSDEQAVLISVDSGVENRTENINIYINDVTDIEKLKVGQTISLWPDHSKSTTLQMPPRPVTQKIEIIQ